MHELLAISRPHHPTLPKDPRTLLHTQCSYNIRDIQGGQYYHFGIAEGVGESCKRAGIDRINCSSHTFRHTFASNYLKANPNQLTELASLMGHDSVNTTAIYTKPSKNDLEMSVEKTETNIYG